MQQRMNMTDLQQHLEGIEFPVSRDELVDYAQSNGAREEIVSQLEQLPEREYRSMAEISTVANASNADSLDDDLGM